MVSVPIRYLMDFARSARLVSLRRSPMRWQGFLRAWLLWSGVHTAVVAQVSSQQEVYVCTDSQGARVYQNTGPSEQCRRLNLEPVLTVPLPPTAVRSGQSGAAAPGGSPASVPANRVSGSEPLPSGQPLPVNPGLVPSANRDNLQAREADRLRILEAEVREEERRLQSLLSKQHSASDERVGQDIARSQASLDALRREIAKVRRP